MVILHFEIYYFLCFDALSGVDSAAAAAAAGQILSAYYHRTADYFDSGSDSGSFNDENNRNNRNNKSNENNENGRISALKLSDQGYSWDFMSTSDYKKQNVPSSLRMLYDRAILELEKEKEQDKK